MLIPDLLDAGDPMLSPCAHTILRWVLKGVATIDEVLTGGRIQTPKTTYSQISVFPLISVFSV